MIRNFPGLKVPQQTYRFQGPSFFKVTWHNFNPLNPELINLTSGNRNLKWGRSDEMFIAESLNRAIFRLTYGKRHIWDGDFITAPIKILEKNRIQTGSSMQNFAGSITLKLNATEKACIMLPNVNVINLRECLSVSPGVHLFSQVKTNNRTNDYMNSE